MPITVHFASNRTIVGPADHVSSYSAQIVSPTDPAAVTYATAFVSDSNLTADTVGAIQQISDIHAGGFSANAIGDLSNPGRNLLIFIHGFANSFENAITRAAFNGQWLAGSGIAAADTTVVGFSWPSLGHEISIPFPDMAYRHDQTMAGQSGFHIASFFARLQPIITAARARGNRVFLLAHSMGNLALQAAVESWFVHGNDDAFLFDETLLAAADEDYNTFDFPPPGRLSKLSHLTRRISIYASTADDVLKVSAFLNGVKRLGQEGPHHRYDPVRFPPSKYRVIDCGAFQDYQPFNLQTSHQYYRRSPGVRTAIANTMNGAV